MTAQTPVGAPTEIKIDAIIPNPQQPREIFDPEKLQELRESIEEHGLIQPIIVEVATEPGRYVLIAGERRWRASRLAGLVTIPATIRPRSDDKTRLIHATIENVQRQDMNDIEKAEAYDKLHRYYGMTDTEIAVTMGLGEKGRPTVANLRRLVDLPTDMKRALIGGVISQSVALAYLPALEIKSSDIEHGRLTNQPNFSGGSYPTPAALRKRLCDPEKYGRKLTRDDVRRLVDEIKDRCTPLPCPGCGKNIKVDINRRKIDDEYWCFDCYSKKLRAEKHTRWCPNCRHEQELNGLEIIAYNSVKCDECGKGYSGYDWRKEPPLDHSKIEYKPLVLEDEPAKSESYSYCKSCKKVLARNELNYKRICVDCRPQQQPPLAMAEITRNGFPRLCPTGKASPVNGANCQGCSHHRYTERGTWVCMHKWYQSGDGAGTDGTPWRDKIKESGLDERPQELNGNGHHPATISTIENPPPAPWEEQQERADPIELTVSQDLLELAGKINDPMRLSSGSVSAVVELPNEKKAIPFGAMSQYHRYLLVNLIECVPESDWTGEKHSDYLRGVKNGHIGFIVRDKSRNRWVMTGQEYLLTAAEPEIKFVPGECPACGHRKEITEKSVANNYGQRCEKCGSINPSTLWAAEATPPADDDMPEWLKDDTPEASQAVKLVYRINQRWALLLDHIPPARLAELDAWLDDIAAEFELETV